MEFSQLATVEQRTDRHVVVADIHGEYGALEQVADRYDSDDITVVVAGDALDRYGMSDDPEKGVLKTLDLIKNLGKKAVFTIGNHEWRFLAGMNAENPIHAERWVGKNSRDGVERNVLSSYNIDRETKGYGEIMEELRQRMSRLGHYSLIASTAPYYETDDFIVVHAGVDTHTPWEEQREQLNETAAAMNQGLFDHLPPQWFSLRLATNTDKVCHTDKTVISGHAHDLTRGDKSGPLENCSPERSLHGGKKIRLASELNPYVYAWEDWSRRVVRIPIIRHQQEAVAAD